MPKPAAETSLPIARAARFLGVHPNTLRAWADQGRIRCLRVNSRGDRRFLVEDLRAFISAVESEPEHRTGADGADPEERVEAIARLGSHLGRLGSVAEIGAAICEEVGALIDADDVRLYRVEGDEVVPVAGREAATARDKAAAGRRGTRGDDDPVGWVARHGKALYEPHATAAAFGSRVPGNGIGATESLLVAPVLHEERTIGVMALARLGADRFSEGELRDLGIYASIAAQALVNAVAHERLQTQARALDRQLRSQAELLRVTERVLTTLDPAAVIAEIADSLAGLIPIDTLGIYIHEPTGRALEPLLARGIGADAFMARRLPDSGEVVSAVLSSGDARSVRRAGRGVRGEPAALILAPLRSRGRVIGILYLKRLGAAAVFDEREFEIVRLFAAHVSIALQNALTHRAVELRAQTDSLTGLRNHGTFRDDLRAAVARGGPLSLLMLDLDDFKAYNDRRGHEAGNGLLRGIAAAISAACRGSDIVYRYGGDEFAIILPGTDVTGASEVAERVRNAVRGVPGDGRRRARIRCSVGVAAFPGDAADAAELLLAADRALYAAKRAGRDRVGTAADGLALASELVPARTPVDELGPVGAR